MKIATFSKLKFKLLALCLVAFIIITAIGFVFYLQRENIYRQLWGYVRSPISLDYTPDQTSTTKTTTSNGGDANDNPIDLSAEEYDKITAEFQTMVDTSSPRQALAQLRTYFDTNSKVADSCHGLAHVIGHMGYVKYKNFATAMEYTDDICGNGYIHGVIEEHFSNITDISIEMSRLCTPGAAAFGSCVHGLGHGLMYFYANDIPQALPYCNQLTDVKQRIWCSEGIFHENFETNSMVHKAKYLSKTDPFYPCEEKFVGDYRPVCYYYAGRYGVRFFDGNYTLALQNCLKAAYPTDCARGTGVVIVRQNITKPADVEYICATGAPTNLVNSCLSGAVSYFQVNSRSKEATADKFCNKFINKYYRDICHKLNGTDYEIVM